MEDDKALDVIIMANGNQRELIETKDGEATKIEVLKLEKVVFIEAVEGPQAAAMFMMTDEKGRNFVVETKTTHLASLAATAKQAQEFFYMKRRLRKKAKLEE